MILHNVYIYIYEYTCERHSEINKAMCKLKVENRL